MAHPRFTHARWILSPALGGRQTTAPAGYLRKSFSLPGPVESAVLNITALGLYECEINGQRVGDHEFAPGWTDYSQRVYFQSYDISKFLHAGENVIGVILGDGWYSGHIAEKNRQYYGERPQLLAQLEITGAGGVATFGSETDWKTSLGPILENDILMGEAFDARRDLGAWSSPGYKEDGWPSACAAPEPAIAIERSPAPPVRRIQALPGHVLGETGDVSWKPCLRLFDFKQNFTGRVRIRVSGARGTHLQIRHGEMLQPDGSLYTENLRSARATEEADFFPLKC